MPTGDGYRPGRVPSLGRLMLPAWAKRSFAIRAERRRLRKVPRQRVDAAALVRANSIECAGIFASGREEAAWRGVASRMKALGISESAGGVNAGDRRALYYLVAALRPRTVLEVGTHIGASTTHIAAALKDAADRGSGSRLVTVDISDVNDSIAKPWKKAGSVWSPREMARLLDCEHIVRFVTAASLDYMKSSEDRFDFVFLDGDHHAATVYREMAASLQLLAPGGLVLLHDYYPALRPLWDDGAVVAGPFLAIQRLQREGAPLEPIPLGRLSWPTRNGSTATSLALVCRKG